MPAKSHPAILDGMGDQPTGGADQSQHNARAPGGGYAERQQPACTHFSCGGCGTQTVEKSPGAAGLFGPKFCV